MFFYKSVSDFRHTVVIQGKKLLISPGDTFSSPVKLSYLFLEEIPNGVSTIKELPVIQSKSTEVNTDVSDAINSIKNQLQDIREEFKAECDKLSEQLSNYIKQTDVSDEAKEKSLNDFKDITNKRLSILKDAVQSMENEVYVIEDDTIDPK